MCMRPPHFKAEGKKWYQVWLITGLAAIALTTGTAPGQVTIRPNSIVRSLATGSGGFVSSGDYLPVFNSTLQAIAISGDSVAVTDGTFISSPGYALLRIDLDQVHSELLGGSAFAVMNIAFDITESMAYDLTGQYVYLGNESAHVDVSLGSGGCIYCGSQLMSSPTTATVGTLPLGTMPGGPTTGVLAPGGYALTVSMFMQANLGLEAASASGYVQLVLGELPCPEDLNDDTVVNVTDLLDLLGAWGPNPGHVGDINDDGTVNVTDLLALLAAWGVCP